MATFVADDHVSRDHAVVGQDAVGAHLHVVPKVGVDHEHVVVANAGDAAAALGANVNGHVLAENVVVADFQARGLAFVFAILGRAAKDAVGMENVVAADGGVTGDGHAVLQLAAGPMWTLGPMTQNGPISTSSAI